MDLDELDLLLEQLAVNSSFAETVPLNTSSSSHGEIAGAGVDMGPPSVLEKSRKPCASNVYSFLPTPVVAAPSHASADKELDSILQELHSLGQGVLSSPHSNPPPLSKKKSLKGEVTSGRQENKAAASPAAGSDRKASSSNQKVDAIDDLLGGLSSDLEKIGVRTVAKGNCASCGKSILGKIIQALGEVWHPEHFVCMSCNKELGTQGFFERDGQAYCEKDYHRLFSPRCGYCKGPIMENILTALDQSWHPEHFFCTHCGNLFGTEGFLEKDGKPYCNRDFYLLFAPKCSGCSEPVKENYLNAANGTWHPECFVCADCLKPFAGGSFMELEGRPLCSLHFHTRQGMLCGGCQQPITGRCISAMGSKYHPEHFTCSFCLHPLSQGRFTEHKGKPYCSPCFTKISA
ncbi:leupaxin [Gadus chalcogrammus]|uniref:leupaxin n=1 Tax=Gadus chalcogrammus TaxID=1042646 RepID=UPI0024C489A5|nr:leupaxin [Gadus chalcogrammus]